MSAESIQVAIRIRPPLPSEGPSPVHCLSPQNNTIHIHNTKNKYHFDHVLSSNLNQEEVYLSCVKQLTEQCLKGYNATVLAYGQTGSGKTYTTMGNKDTVGVVPRALVDVFESLEKLKEKELTMNKLKLEYEVRLQFLELYGEEIRDLLSTSLTVCTIRDFNAHGVAEPEVNGALELPVQNVQEAMDLLQKGLLRRVTGATAMNAESSRSHAIISLLVEQTRCSVCLNDNQEEEAAAEANAEVRRSKFNFVDLAGSERQKRTNATGQRLKEGIDINKGLLALGNVISALGDTRKRGATFVPYRDSKLTRLLKGSLGGNHKTLMIACVSPVVANMEESICCLRYANRAKNIQNNATINIDAGSKVLAELKAKVQNLAIALLKLREETGRVADEAPYSKAVLHSLAGGGKGNFIPAEITHGVENCSQNHGRGACVELNSMYNNTVDEKDALIQRIQSVLKESKAENRLLKDELYAERAEKEYYRLQVRGKDKENKSISVDENENNNQVEVHSGRMFASALLGSDTSSKGKSKDDDEKTKTTFTEKIRAYEKEISKLKDELHKIRARIESDSASFENKTKEVDNTSADEEEIEEQLREKIIKKYAQDVDDESDNEGPVKDEVVEPPTLNEDDESGGDFLKRQKTMDAHVVDLSKNILAKEELVERLSSMQNKYDEMYSFYKDKLSHMENTVKEKESEREQYMIELTKLEQKVVSRMVTDTGDLKKMKEEVASRNAQISELKKKETELRGLASVASKNETTIFRLKDDISNMKRQRVDLQKQMVTERKEHTKEMRSLKKHACQLDREAMKLRNESERKTKEVEYAQKLASDRLEEVSKLRSKYRDAEKQLRMQTLKSGVLTQRVGVDPVLLGKKGKLPRSNFSQLKESTIDTTKIKKYLEEKIGEIGKKESISEKIAQEWEEHLSLTLRKSELQAQEENDKDSDELEAIDIQLDFKEQRIRSLSKRLGKGTQKSNGGASAYDLFENKDFQKMATGMSPVLAAQATAKVLFGMFFRERKRVTSLAQTASLLDGRLIEVQQHLEEQESALKAHITEQLSERSSMTQQHQEVIQALMTIVEEGTKPGSSGRGQRSGETLDEEQSYSTSTLLTLAKERISALERQLQSTEEERRVEILNQRGRDELQSELDAQKEENLRLQNDLQNVRSSLSTIRKCMSPRDISNLNKSGFHTVEIDGIVEVVATSGTNSAAKLSETLKDNNMHLHYDSCSSCDDEDGDAPEWADDIMADLEIIARGEVPESMKSIEKSNVFSRLTNPNNYTGTQKHARELDLEIERSRAKQKSPRSFMPDGSAFSQFLPEKQQHGNYSTNTTENATFIKEQPHSRPSSRNGDRTSVFERLQTTLTVASALKRGDR